MSGRVVSADTNTSRRREFVCPVQHGRECLNGLKNSSSYEPTGEKSLEIDEVYAEKIKLKFMQINRILYHSIQTLIKNVFLLNFAHELLMSFLMYVIQLTPNQGSLVADYIK